MHRWPDCGTERLGFMREPILSVQCIWLFLKSKLIINLVMGTARLFYAPSDSPPGTTEMRTSPMLTR
jgi:hypothetical protein